MSEAKGIQTLNLSDMESDALPLHQSPMPDTWLNGAWPPVELRASEGMESCPPPIDVSLDGDACISGLDRSGCRSDCSVQELCRAVTPVSRPVTTCAWLYAWGSVLDAQKVTTCTHAHGTPCGYGGHSGNEQSFCGDRSASRTTTPLSAVGGQHHPLNSALS